MFNVLELLSKTEEFFKSKNIPDPKLDAQLLLCEVLKCKRLDLFLMFDKPLTQEQVDLFREYVRRRAKREPLQYIVGEVDFFNIKISCDKRALIPRPETEELCDIICTKYFFDKTQQLKILDLGTGTGAIALGLANHFENAKVLAVDKSADALALAKENCEKLGLNGRVEFLLSDWFENVNGKFDIIISNPPYLTEEEVSSAQDEVKNYEPLSALQSDNEGFCDIEKIINKAFEFLNSDGKLFLETGINHAEKIQKTERASFEIIKDSSQRDRFAVLS